MLGCVAWNVLAFAVVAPRMLPNFWFERGVVVMGEPRPLVDRAAVGARADPRLRTPVPFAFFCFKLLFFVPQSGGKAHAVVGLIARLGELSALCVCAAVAVGWWLLWDAAFRGRA